MAATATNFAKPLTNLVPGAWVPDSKPVYSAITIYRGATTHYFCSSDCNSFLQEVDHSRGEKLGYLSQARNYLQPRTFFLGFNPRRQWHEWQSARFLARR